MPGLVAGDIYEDSAMTEHFYESLPGYFDFQTFYLAAVGMARPGDVLVELGVYKGRSLAFLAVEAERSGKALRIVGVDLFEQIRTVPNPFGDYDAGCTGEQTSEQADVRRAFEAAGCPVPALVEACSYDAADDFADGSVAMVYVDADHHTGLVRRDIAAWWPKIRPGGRLGGHDYTGEPSNGVTIAVDEFVKDAGVPLGRIGVTWWVEKPFPTDELSSGRAGGHGLAHPSSPLVSCVLLTMD